MGEFDYLLELSGTTWEQSWLTDRLETLSVRERCVLAAASRRRPPENAADAINCLQTLIDYEVCPAGSYEELGRLYLRQMSHLPEDVLPYVDMDFEQLGQQYENKHPGLFVGNYYVEYPTRPAALFYHEQDRFVPDDAGWAVKLKLASPTAPEGVWLRLPGYDGKITEGSDEVVLALDALKVKSLEDCILLEARCILVEAGELMEQYSSVTELVRDGADLGYILDEQGQGEPHWNEKFAAAMEYENCRTLKFVLAISQNLHCYEWISCEELDSFAAERLRSCGVKDELIESGVIDLKRYAENLLDTAGYMQAIDESGFLIRNGKQFDYMYTPSVEQGADTVQLTQSGRLHSSQEAAPASSQIFI